MSDTDGPAVPLGERRDAPSQPLADLPGRRPVVSTRPVYSGMIWDVVRDEVDLGEAGVVTRDYVRHPGAVAVLALDDQDRVLLVRQYRHPVGMELWEPPAGLLDVEGEAPLLAAQRELVEETDHRAERWDVLIDWFNSPGGMDEAIRVYLARGLSPVPEHERHTREHEELDMVVRWFPLEEAHLAVLEGRIHNPAAVVGLLAAHAARRLGWSTLRPATAPWDEHPRHRPGTA